MENILLPAAQKKLGGGELPLGRLAQNDGLPSSWKGAAIGPSSRVLEVGCGTGMFTAEVAESGASIIAVDLSPDLVAIAARRNLNRVQFVLKNFEYCEVDRPFDAVIGSSVLHHLDMERALPKMFSLLKLGGRSSFTEPNMLNP